MDLLPVHIAVLTIANDAAEGRSASAAVAERARAAGHTVVAEETVKDAEAAIRDQLVRWIAEPNIDVVIALASVDSESASAALAPLVMQTLPGFTDLFRWLTFQEIGASAMLSAAEAAQCESTFVFVLPAHEVAVRAAMDKLILPQLDARTKPKNLVTQMPRLKDEAKRVQTAMQAVPTPVAVEKTEGGSGVMPKLPARPKPTTNTIARKQEDPPTKPIDLAKLEKQIALSNVNEAQTKQVQIGPHDAKTKVVDMSAHQAKTRVVDMTGRVLPRVPPGADESAADGDDPLTFQPPAPAAVAKATPPAPLPSIVKAPEKAPVKTPPAVSVPSFSTPVARTPAIPPITPRKEVVTPVSPVSQVIAARDQAITPVSPLPVVKPPVHVPAAATDVPTPPVDLQAMRAPPEPAPDAGESSEQLEAIEPLEVVDTPAATPPPRPRTPTPPPPIPVRDFDKVEAPLSAALTQPPVKRKPTQPPPVDPIAQATAKPLGNVDLPEGEFVYPIKKSSGALVLKIFGALALLGVGFFAVVQLFPRDTQATQTAAVDPAPAPVAIAPLDAAAVAEAAPADAAEVAPEPPEEIELEPTPVATAEPEPEPASAPSRGSSRPTRRPTAATQPSASPSPAAKPSEPTPAPEPKPAEASTDPSCDEVSCVLAKYDRPCCERYRPKDTFTPTTGTTPEALDKRLVKAGVEKIKPRVVACGEQAATSGTVKLAVSVDPEGAVKNVSVTESPSTALGECVAGAMRKATFAKTINGGEFIYPFVF